MLTRLMTTSEPVNLPASVSGRVMSAYSVAILPTVAAVFRKSGRDGVAREDADAVALAGQEFNDMAADETGTADDSDQWIVLHGILL